LCLPAVAAPMAQWPGLFSRAESVLPAASSGEMFQSVCLRRHRGAIPRVVECIACIVGCGQRGTKRVTVKVQWDCGFVLVAAKVAVVWPRAEVVAGVQGSCAPLWRRAAKDEGWRSTCLHPASLGLGIASHARAAPCVLPAQLRRVLDETHSRERWGKGEGDPRVSTSRRQEPHGIKGTMPSARGWSVEGLGR